MENPPVVCYPSELNLHFGWGFPGPCSITEVSPHHATSLDFHQPRWLPFLVRRSQGCHIPGLCVPGTWGSQESVSSKYPMISAWKIHTPQTYPKHSSKISKLAPETDSCAAWELREFGGSSRGSELDWNHSTISHRRGWTPSNSSTQTSLRLHNLPLPAVGEIPGTGGKTNKTSKISK